MKAQMEMEVKGNHNWPENVPEFVFQVQQSGLQGLRARDHREAGGQVPRRPGEDGAEAAHRPQWGQQQQQQLRRQRRHRQPGPGQENQEAQPLQGGHGPGGVLQGAGQGRDPAPRALQLR